MTTSFYFVFVYYVPFLLVDVAREVVCISLFPKVSYPLIQSMNTYDVALTES